MKKIKIPFLKGIICHPIFFKNSAKYWDDWYSLGGDSGHGSYGEYARFKADIVNKFIRKAKVKSVIDFGCGDGNQLSYFKCNRYIGLDVSSATISKCMNKFQYDSTKSFFLFNTFLFRDNAAIFKADLALSLDILYHIVEDDAYQRYLDILFASAGRYVIIYSSNIYAMASGHVRHRKFTDYIERNITGWKLKEFIKNPLLGSCADFYIFEKLKPKHSHY